MERRQVIGTCAGPVFGGGIALGLGSLNHDLEEYQALLTGASIAFLTAALTTWAILLLTAQRERKGERGFVEIHEAADWLYNKASEPLRAALRGGVPDPFATVRDHAVGFYQAAADDGVCVLFGRRGEGLALERLTKADIEMDRISAALSGNHLPAPETFVRRSDMRKVKAHYERAVKASRY